MIADLELEQARRDYASDPTHRAHRERLATLNERSPDLDKEFEGLPCGPTLLLFGKAIGSEGQQPLKLPPGKPKLELKWRGVGFEPEDDRLGQGFSDPYGRGFFEPLYQHGATKAKKSAKDLGGYAVAQFTLDGEPLVLLSETYKSAPFWEDGSEAGDTDFSFPGPRLGCNGTWLVLAALCKVLPAWDKESQLSPSFKISWGEGRQDGVLSLRFAVQYLDEKSKLPCQQFQDYDFDLADRSYTFRHHFAKTQKR